MAESGAAHSEGITHRRTRRPMGILPKINDFSLLSVEYRGGTG
jgi:hypothetical protein